VDTVIIAKLDRLTRSVKDLAELLERFTRRGVSLVSVADSLDTRTAAGRLVLNIMVSVSQWEREAIGERTRDAMHHKRANGERVGTVPFGYRTAADGLHLEADPAEQGILSRIRELKAAGHTTRQIADELNRQGFTTRRGTAWRFQYVAEALRAAPAGTVVVISVTLEREDTANTAGVPLKVTRLAPVRSVPRILTTAPNCPQPAPFQQTVPDRPTV
jgi:site-specific DNA recombinase